MVCIATGRWNNLTTSRGMYEQKRRNRVDDYVLDSMYAAPRYPLNIMACISHEL